MKRIIAFGLALLLAACAPRENIRTPPPAAQAAPATRGMAPFQAGPRAVGEEALGDIQKWYDDTSANCGSATLPAFLCTGVMLRATENDPAFYPWDPSPGSQANGGVSFSWLRSDTNFSQMVFDYANGFIFYPIDRVPAGKDRYEVLCVFPMDSDTYHRPTNQGCGQNSYGGAGSRPCDEQGIETAGAWNSHFNALSAGSKYNGQCGWNVRRGAPNTASRFNAAIGARAGMSASYWAIQDELRIGVWNQGQGGTLPLRAFFYLPDVGGALAKAQDDQKRYTASYGVQIPIVRLTLPTFNGGEAGFAYSQADQGEGGESGPGPGGIDFENTRLVENFSLLSIGDVDIVGRRQASIRALPSSERSAYIRGRYLAFPTITDGDMELDSVKYPLKTIAFSYSHSGSSTLSVRLGCYPSFPDYFIDPTFPKEGRFEITIPPYCSAQYAFLRTVHPDGREDVWKIDDLLVE